MYTIKDDCQSKRAKIYKGGEEKSQSSYLILNSQNQKVFIQNNKTKIKRHRNVPK